MINIYSFKRKHLPERNITPAKIVDNDAEENISGDSGAEENISGDSGADENISDDNNGNDRTGRGTEFDPQKDVEWEDID